METTYLREIKATKGKTKKILLAHGPTLQLNIQNKITLYKAVIKPVWTYGLQLWGAAVIPIL